MKKWGFRLSWIVVDLALIAIDIYWMAKGFSVYVDSETVFVSFCFLLEIVPLAFELVLIFMSFSKGTYFLPDLYFENDGTINKISYLIFGILSLALGFAFIWFLLALLGINPNVPSMTSIQIELVVSTTSFLFSTCFFALLFGLIHKNDGSIKEII
jgi:hypothetical protein